MAELKFRNKKVFFTVLYRSPSHKYNSVEFQNFLHNFQTLSSSTKAENPYACFYTGDFNAHSQSWWCDGDTNAEGNLIDDLFSSLNLSQIIIEPTNFTPNCRPSCIDLIATDQPNIVLDSGVRASLDLKCHHQVIFCQSNMGIPIPIPCER